MLAIHTNVDATGHSAWDYLGFEPSPVLLPDPLADPALRLCHALVEAAGDVVIPRHEGARGPLLIVCGACRLGRAWESFQGSHVNDQVTPSGFTSGTGSTSTARECSIRVVVRLVRISR